MFVLTVVKSYQDDLHKVRTQAQAFMQKVTEIAHTYINMLISENVDKKGGGEAC